MSLNLFYECEFKRESMVTPDLSSTVPKTITAIGKLNTTLNLPRIFDVLPLFEEEGFRVIRYKHEGIMREASDNGVVKESDTEFKNSITMEIEDQQYSKVRAVKIYCGGVHMCGHRSVPRAKRLGEIIIWYISKTDSFIKQLVSSDWSGVTQHPLYEKMMSVALSILPPGSVIDSLSRERLKRFFQGIVQEGGLFHASIDNEDLKMINLETVMINYSYSIDTLIKDRFKRNSKEDFIRSFFKTIRKMNIQEFDIFMYYDILTSPMGWSGSIPLKFTHKQSGKAQWMTLQLRRGTVINSGPNVDLMQRAVNALYELFDNIRSGGDPIVDIDGRDTQEKEQH
jgi:hypothetical protein